MSLIKNLWKTDKTCLRKFLFNFGWKGLIGFKKFQKRKKKGEMFPAFQFISITNDCNLSCQGCWVSRTDNSQSLDITAINKIIEQSKVHGSYFFGILGGEPLLYKAIFEVFKSHPDCYFQLFTNGTLLSDEVAEKLRKLANVTPLISFEGNEEVADIRRGSQRVYERTLRAVDFSVKHKLVTGVAISVCKSNIDMALSDAFINMLHDKGVIYLWYYIYRPAGENPCYELALSYDEIMRLRKFLVKERKKSPLILIDSYWNADGEPFCPAAEGLSHHINPAGNIEPCPVIQFSCDHIAMGDLKQVYENSAFLKNFKTEVHKHTNGCILMENPAWLSHFARLNGALNTSGRVELADQLENAPATCSHGSSEIIPEEQWLYRIAKKRAFFGLGAYG
jgi:MoaA/NifB/PqqE/SkfB family radical SAM enzyme